MTRSDFCLLSVFGLVSAAAMPLVAVEPQRQQASVLVTKNMCCAHESVPAIKELSKVPGIGRVLADHEKRTLTIVPSANAAPSPRAIWEAAMRAKIEPIQLATPQGVYNNKPLR